MRINSRKVFLGLLLAAAVRGQDDPSSASLKAERKLDKERQESLRRNELSISVQGWEYSRIYPLLDGLFQDANAASVTAPQLDATKSNATSLDATQQSLQIQAQFSQLAGIQNTAVAQVASNNAALQSLIAQQTAPLLQQYTDAVSAQNQAQAALATATASGDATAQATAQTVLNNATTQLTNVANAIKAVTGILNTFPSGASTSLSQPGPPTSSQLPSAVVTNATNVPSGSPNLPPTKQMDNYLDLLWERLSRLIGTIVKPDSVKSGDIYLIKFDAGIYPLDRKKQLLDVTYNLTGCDAQVLDLFPRTAALNITESKYKDSSFFIGALLSFFSLGTSVAYNREHLQASQWLGQASYITGHGVGANQFGWLFGIGLGDNAISPGVRSTFALIRADAGCPLKINLDSAIWQKPPSFHIEKYSILPEEQSTKACGNDKQCKKDFPAPYQGPWEFAHESSTKQPAHSSSSGEADRSAETATASPSPAAVPLALGRLPTANAVVSLAFNRIEMAASSCVTVAIRLRDDMDQQQTVSVEGALIPRVRDSFGRGATGGSQGLLEANALTNCPNWIADGPRSVLLTLSPANYGNRFPQILLNSPVADPIDVAVSVTETAKKMTPSNAIQISGQSWQPACASSAACVPSLAFMKSAAPAIGVARRTFAAAGANRDQLSITLLNPPATGAAPSTGSAAPAVQVLTDREQPLWADDAEVAWIQDATHLTPLTCRPDRGSRLLCDVPELMTSAHTGAGLTLAVYDAHHSGGAIRSFAHTPPCGDHDLPCASPLVWNISSPVLDCSSCTKTSDDGKSTSTDLSAARWAMRVTFVNVADGDKASLLNYPGAGHSFDETIKCEGDSCHVTFTFPRCKFNDLGDLMTLRITHADPSTQKGAISKPFWVTNLRANVSPVVSFVATDFSAWSGQNLVFDQVQVNGTVTSVQCDVQTNSVSNCAKTSANPFDSSAGLMYFVAPADKIRIPMLQANATGGNAPVKFTPPAPAPKTKKPANGAEAAAHALSPDFVAPPPPGPTMAALPKPALNLAPPMTVSQ